MSAESKLAEATAAVATDCEDCCRTGDPSDEDLAAFPNKRMFHDLRVFVSDWTWLSAVADVLKRHGAAVERLSLQAQSKGCIVLCRAERLKPREAAQAIADIRRLDGTLSASVEHLLLRR